MSAGSASRAGQAAAESLMLDEFTAYAQGETTDADGLTVYGDVEQEVTYGKVPNRQALNQDATAARTISTGGVDHVVIAGGLHLPYASTPQVGWEYVLTGLAPETHPSMLGKRYRVIETHPASHMTAWRVDVVEIV